jgi:UDP-glucose 4-epimerase
VKKNKNILLTGGAGYIGAHTFVALSNSGYTPIIVDNFSNSSIEVIKKLNKILKKKVIFYNIDLRDKSKLFSIFKIRKIDSVIHFAGLKSVDESLKEPMKYFNNNIQSTISLLECMQKKKVFKIIFSSSATVYDPKQSLPWKETSNIGKTVNPYGTSKYIIERILADLANSDSRWKVKIARYFNPISNHSSGLIGDNPRGTPNNLIPYIMKVAKKKLPYLKIYGKDYDTKDGTCIRDYIHVLDLAEGHIAMLKNSKLTKGLEVYNFGTGKGFTVLEVVKEFEKQTGNFIPIRFSKRRKGDAPISFCSADKAFKYLSWKAKRNLKECMLDIKISLQNK